LDENNSVNIQSARIPNGRAEAVRFSDTGTKKTTLQIDLFIADSSGLKPPQDAKKQGPKP